MKVLIKSGILIHLYVIFSIKGIVAQPPQSINYQGIARNAQGQPLVNQLINLRLSILDSSATGSVVYKETHNTTTNNSGLFNLSIGKGFVVSGTFSSIQWGQGSKWLQVEMDTSGGNNFQLIGVTQFLSVPYALYSKYVTSFPKTIQERLDEGETPKHIYDTGISVDRIIGKLYAGGIIFYLNTITGNGIVAALSDQSLSVPWSLNPNQLVGGTSDTIGAGKINTTLIVNAYGIGNYAAYLCDTLNLNGYSDWFLPSLNEIKEMDKIIDSPYFMYSQYWSSTEYSFYQAWYLFDNNGTHNIYKYNLYGVRAVRYF